MKEFLLGSLQYFLIAIFVWFIILTFLLIKILRSWKRIFYSGKKNLADTLENQLKDIEDIHKSLEDAFVKIKKLKVISDNTIQKVGIMRFNPFQDMGSDQSFSVALLDSKNNGVVITSLASRSGTRIYAKPIENKQSKYQLIEEEIEAIKKAEEFATHIRDF